MDKHLPIEHKLDSRTVLERCDCVYIFDKSASVSIVKNLANDKTMTYNLPPREAVKTAYLQGTLKNYNTWLYKGIEVPIAEGEHSIACGDWCALKGES